MSVTDAPLEDTVPSLPETLRAHGEIGRGGIGRVLIAFDSHLGREVAVKELLVGSPGGHHLPKGLENELLARFLREARVTAQLEHPSIVPVYQLGRRPDGTIYYTMKLIRGRTLADAVRRAVDLRERLHLLGHFVDLCQAIAYAHSRGVIHRDIKPQNVMVGEFGETVVLDWGLAKVQGKLDVRGEELSRQIAIFRAPDAVTTMPGSTLGTPAYMSPEQAQGKIDALDARSDVWSLGIVLYEILTGRHPFEGLSPIQCITKILTADISSVRSTTPDAPEELAAIAERALRRDIAERYPSAKTIADEVMAFQSGERVLAHNYSAAQLLTRFAQKHRAQLTVGMAASVLVLVLSVLGHLRVLGERDVAVRAERESRARLSEAFIERARSSAMIHDWSAAEFYAATALARDPSPSARGMILSIDGVFRPKLRLRAQTFSGCNDVALMAGGDTVACAEGADIELWDMARGVARHRLRTSSGWVLRLAGASTRPLLVAGSDDGTVRVLDLSDDSGKILELAPMNGAVTRLALSANGRWLAVSGAGRGLRVYETHQATPKVELPLEGTTVEALAMSPNGEIVAVGTGDRAIELRERASGRMIQRFMGHDRAIRTLEFSPDSRFLASTGDDRTIRVWNLAAGRISRVIAGHETEVSRLKFAADGKLLFSACGDGTLRIFNRVSGREIARLTNTDEGPALAMDLNRRTLVVAHKDKSIQAFDVEAALASPPTTYRARAGLTAVAASSDGALIAFGEEDGSVHLIARARPSRSLTLPAHAKGVVGLAFSPDSGLLASASKDGLVRLWDVARGAPLRQATFDALLGVAFIDDGTTVAALETAAVSLWPLEPSRPTRRIVAPETGGRASFTGVAWNAERRELIVSSRDHQLWFARPDDERFATRGGKLPQPLSSIAASPDGTRLGVGGANGLVSVLDAQTGNERVRLSEHDADVTSLAFAPTGEILAAGSVDGHARLFELERGRERARLEAHADELSALVMTSSPLRLITGARDRTLRVFPLQALETPAAVLLERATRDLGVRLSGSRLTRDRPTRFETEDR